MIQLPHVNLQRMYCHVLKDYTVQTLNIITPIVTATN